MIVMTLDGKVIKKVENRGLSIDGDQLSWDGRDDKGFYVSSGVYLLAFMVQMVPIQWKKSL